MLEGGLFCDKSLAMGEYICVTPGCCKVIMVVCGLLAVRDCHGLSVIKV